MKGERINKKGSFEGGHMVENYSWHFYLNLRDITYCKILNLFGTFSIFMNEIFMFFLL
jgi:hypothetical protein